MIWVFRFIFVFWVSFVGFFAFVDDFSRLIAECKSFLKNLAIYLQFRFAFGCCHIARSLSSLKVSIAKEMV